MAKKLHTSPKGRAVFPHLHAPDTKFDADGIFSTKVKMSAGEAQDTVNMIEDAISASVEAAKTDNPKTKKIKRADPPYVVDDETGDVTINFKMKHKGKKKSGETFTRQPAIFDATGKPVKKGLRIGGGSEIRVSYEIAPFYTALIGAGVSLRLAAVQVIDLVEFGGGNADYFGFDKEDGFDGAVSATDGDDTEPTDLADGDDGAKTPGADF